MMKKRGKIRLAISLGILFLLLSGAAFIWRYVAIRIGEAPDAEQTAQFATLKNFRNGEFFSVEAAPLHVGKFVRSVSLFSFLFGVDGHAPKNAPPAIRPEFSAVPESFSAVWLGHSTVIFELAGGRFITDPVFGSASPVPFVVKRHAPPVLNAADLPHLNFVLLTHDHYDHLEYETIRTLSRRPDLRFVVPLGVGARLRGWGVPVGRISELNWNETVEIDGIKITALPARHFSGRSLADRNRTLWCAYALSAGGVNLFFGGDGAYGSHFKAIGEQYGPFDLACLEIDAWNPRWPDSHLFLRYIPPVMNELRAKKFLPIHWGVFDLALHPWLESIRMAADECRKAGIEFYSPKFGERIDFSKENKTVPWWENLK